MCPVKRNGFTLIELLIVIAIILILIAIALPNFLDAQARAKVTHSEGDLRSLEYAMEAYALDWKKYFRDRQPYHLTTPIPYIQQIPEDPFGPINDRDTGYNDVLSRYGSPIKRYYIMHGPETFEDVPAMKRIGVLWVITGLGPDKGWFDNADQPSVSFFRYPRYSPTNGSRSRGNLEKVGPGQIPHERYRFYWD